ARRVTAPLDRALVREAAGALEEQLQTFTPAEPATCIVVDRHGALLDPAPLRGAATVVRDGGHVLDRRDLESRRLQRADRGFPTGAWSLDPDFDPLHAVVHGFTGTGLRRHLR